MPHQPRSHGHVQKIVSMTQILALGVVLSREIHLSADTPAVIQIHGDTTEERICLPGLPARSEFVDVHRIISWTGSHLLVIIEL